MNSELSSLKTNLDWMGELGDLRVLTCRRLESKRNEVWLLLMKSRLGAPVFRVLKQYVHGDRGLEITTLKTLKSEGMAVPSILIEPKGALVMEYIEYPTLLECIEIWEGCGKESRNEELAGKLSDWMDGYYRIMGKLFGKNIRIGDMNLRNFLYGGELVGLDFETPVFGRREEDTGQLLAFALTYDPPFTSWKKDFLRFIYKRLTHNMSLDKLITIESYQEALKEISDRRGIGIPEDVFSLLQN